VADSGYQTEVEIHNDVLSRVAAVNVGIAAFGESVRAQGAQSVDVDWRPPAGGDQATVHALERLRGAYGERIAAANHTVLERMESTSPQAVAVARADEVIPALRDRVLIHAGTAIEWERICDPQRRALIAACIFEDWARDHEQAASLL
jgi:hypothetical protein